MSEIRLAKHLKWVKGILVALCVMCVEKPLVQRRTLFHIFSQHAMVRRALIVINVTRCSSLRKAWMNTSLPDQVVEAMHQFTDKRLSRSNYFGKDINSDIQGESLLKGINHIN